MSDDLKALKDAMSAVGGHLQDMQGEQSATTREVKELGQGLQRLENRSLALEAGYAALGGTFASLARRVDALEKKAS